MAQASKLICGCLYGPPPIQLSLGWPSNNGDHIPYPAAGRTAEILAALAPFDMNTRLLALDRFTLDKAEVLALATALPVCPALLLDLPRLV